MSNKNLLILIRNILIALVFYAVGRFIVVEMGSSGTWIILAGVVIFYAIWWINYQRNKKK